jgi:hypothetical protein
MFAADREQEPPGQCARSLKLDAGEHWTCFLLTLIGSPQGNLKEAVQFARKAHALASWYVPVIAALARVLAPRKYQRGGSAS